MSFLTCPQQDQRYLARVCALDTGSGFPAVSLPLREQFRAAQGADKREIDRASLVRTTVSSQESGLPLHLGPSRFAAHRTPVSSHESDAHFSVGHVGNSGADDKAVDFCELRHTVRGTTRRVLQNVLSCFPSTCSCVSRIPWRNSLPSDLKELQHHATKVVFAGQTNGPVGSD